MDEDQARVEFAAAENMRNEPQDSKELAGGQCIRESLVRGKEAEDLL